MNYEITKIRFKIIFESLVSFFDEMRPELEESLQRR